MILQNMADTGAGQAKVFVIKNVEHALLAASLAEHFGNDRFDIPQPFDEILYLVTHHDHGWLELDENPPLDEQGLPYNLVKTPFNYILETSRASPDFNQAHSPFCGLVSSMHSYGLYNGRYGLSDAINLDWVPPEYRTELDAMLDSEMSRQQQLRTECAQYTDETVFTVYKFLQFVDACALYFNANQAGHRGNAVFRNVPQKPGADVDIELRETTDGSYQFEPFPFNEDVFELYQLGRYLGPGELQSLENGMKSTETEQQTLKIRRN